MTREHAVRRLIALLALAAAVGGCGGGSGPDRDAVPSDLEIRYRWNSGVSNVGPDYAAYAVSLEASGAGTIHFTVGHPSADQDLWDERFAVGAADLLDLYSLLHDAGVFSESWAAREPVPGSGGGSSLVVIADEVTYRVPVDLADRDHSASIAPVYESVRSLVPREIWEGFETRREDHIDAHDH